MKKSVAIIGANFGDETKGKHVDYFSDSDTIVVRTSGGSNAGHTVVKDNIKRIFKHFGSGTLSGASTYLSEYFISNPILFCRELDELKSIGIKPKIFVSPFGKLTFPVDMMINQIAEENRGDNRHGSCGVGINETMKRFETFHAFGTISNIFDIIQKYTFKEVVDCLHTHSKEWCNFRLKELKITPSSEWNYALGNKNIVEDYVENCIKFFDNIEITRYIDYDKKIVFEGSQGLLLDQNHYYFPHVTHSNTGLKNIIEISKKQGIDELDVIYLTRAYTTRHGAGPFPREDVNLSFDDETNLPNPFQGTLRFGYLDLDLLKESIDNDLKHADKISVRYGISISCLDQLEKNGKYIFWKNNQKEISYSWYEFCKIICEHINADKNLCFASFGPDSKNITKLWVD